MNIPTPDKISKESPVKDLVFIILAEHDNKTATEIHKEIKKKYYPVSFQAILKAINLLLDQKVISKKNKLYSINENWLFETRVFIDKLYSEKFKVKKPLKKSELTNITVYTLSNLLELDKLWNELLTHWAKFEVNDKRNCWKGSHAWWLLPRLQEEDILHDFMISQGIKTYNLWTKSTQLDKLATKYYNKKNEFTKIKSSLDEKEDSHIAAFGENLIKFEIPAEISKKLEKIYIKSKNLVDLDIKETIDIFKKNSEIEFTIIKDKMLANKIKEEIISNF